MKVKITVEQEVEIKTLQVVARVWHWEDATVNGESDENGDLIPFRAGDVWAPVIDVDKGIVIGWPKGTTADIHYKVCDDGTYHLQDDKDVIVMSVIDDYVPEIMCPEENGYGDYIIMNIDENGKIANWNFTIEDFQVNTEQ